MEKIKDHTFHDRKEIFFDMEDDEGYDSYNVEVDYWFIDDPEVNFKCIDKIYINKIIKNNEELYFIKQSDIKESVRTEVINLLEREL